jgi:hypothetical protein
MITPSLGQSHLDRSAIFNSPESVEGFRSTLSEAEGVSAGEGPKPSFSDYLSLVPEFPRRMTQRFLKSNEVGQERTLNWLRGQEVFGDTFVGTGCLFSLDAFSKRPKAVSNLLILDISSKVKEFWDSVDEIVKTSDHREVAMLKMVEKFPKLDRDYLEGEGRWLSTDEQFLKVKDLFSSASFSFHYADFHCPYTLNKLGEALKLASRRIDTIYESNIGLANFANSGKFGGEGLAKLVKDTLVANLVYEDLEKKYLEIYAAKDSGGDLTQHCFIRTFENPHA